MSTNTYTISDTDRTARYRARYDAYLEREHEQPVPPLPVYHIERPTIRERLRYLIALPKTFLP